MKRTTSPEPLTPLTAPEQVPIDFDQDVARPSEGLKPITIPKLEKSGDESS